MEDDPARDRPDAPSAEINWGLLYLRRLAELNELQDNLGGLESRIQVKAKDPPAGKPAVKDYVRGIFSDKTKAEKTIVRQILNEIVLRERIRGEALRALDEDICRCETWLHEIRAITERQYLPPEESLQFGSRRTTLEMRLLELSALRGKAEAEAWSDLSTLRRYMLFAFRDYWTAARRSELLGFEVSQDDETAAQ